MTKKLFSKICVVRLMLLSAVLLLTTACTTYDLQPPPETADGWEVGTLEEVGLEEKPIAEALQLIEDRTYADVHSLLIVKDGRIVVEEYFPGHVWVYDAEHFQGPYTEFDRDSLHTIMSVTKAFTSAAVGIAVDEGVIGDEQDTVLKVKRFPAYSVILNLKKGHNLRRYVLIVKSLNHE